MHDCETAGPAGRNPDLENRLVRRRAAEEAFRTNRGQIAHRDSLLLRDHITAPILRWGLQALGLYARGARNALQPVVWHLRLEFDSLPESFHGFRLLHLSDLHIDGMDGLAEVVADRVAALPVDLCVMTGDYRFEVDGPCDAVYPRLATILSSVRAHYGVVGILGNHDEAGMVTELENLGVRMLINEAVVIAKGGARLWMIGVDDPHHYGCDDLEGALEGVPKDAFKVALAHSPELFVQAARAGIHLYLCGHTHAGQIRLPRIGEIGRASCRERV